MRADQFRKDDCYALGNWRYLILQVLPPDTKNEITRLLVTNPVGGVITHNFPHDERLEVTEW